MKPSIELVNQENPDKKFDNFISKLSIKGGFIIVKKPFHNSLKMIEEFQTLTINREDFIQVYTNLTPFTWPLQKDNFQLLEICKQAFHLENFNSPISIKLANIAYNVIDSTGKAIGLNDCDKFYLRMRTQYNNDSYKKWHTDSCHLSNLNIEGNFVPLLSTFVVLGKTGTLFQKERNIFSTDEGGLSIFLGKDPQNGAMGTIHAVPTSDKRLVFIVLYPVKKDNQNILNLIDKIDSNNKLETFTEMTNFAITEKDYIEQKELFKFTISSKKINQAATIINFTINLKRLIDNPNIDNTVKSIIDAAHLTASFYNIIIPLSSVNAAYKVYKIHNAYQVYNEHKTQETFDILQNQIYEGQIWLAALLFSTLSSCLINIATDKEWSDKNTGSTILASFNLALAIYNAADYFYNQLVGEVNSESDYLYL